MDKNHMGTYFMLDTFFFFFMFMHFISVIIRHLLYERLKFAF